MLLGGKVAIVTGSGQGIGAGIAATLAREGCAVVVADYNAGTAGQTADKIKGEGGKALAVTVDVSSSEQVGRMADQALEYFGGIDILVNDAGIYPRSLVQDMSTAEWRRVLEVNLKGAFLCCKAVLPSMLSRRSGRIINIASGHSYKGGAGFSHYAASKAALIAFSKSLALELAPCGILVNAVAPGTSDTPMNRLHSTEKELMGKSQKIPLGRLGRPEDVAEVIAFLVSARNTFTTGQAIFVNGGAVMP